MNRFVPRLKTNLVCFLVLLLSFVSVASTHQRRSFGSVDVGGQKVLVTYGHSTDVGEDDPRLGQRLSSAALDQEARRILQIIRGVGEFSRGLKMPRKIHLNLAMVTLNPAADSFGGDIFAGRTFGTIEGNGRLFTQHPNEMIPVIAHEFGHMIFHENVLAELEVTKFIAPIYKEVTDIISILDRLEERQIRLAQMQGPRVQQELEKIQREVDQWGEELERLGKRLEPAVDILSATTPYNEFYSDVIAVLYTGKPNSVAAAIHMVTPASGDRSERRISRSEIRSRQFIRKGAGSPLIASDHALFYEVREMIWDEYLQRPQVMREHRAAVVEGVTRAVRSEVRWMLSQRANLEKNPQASVRLLNRRLAEKIRQELSRI